MIHNNPPGRWNLNVCSPMVCSNCHPFFSSNLPQSTPQWILFLRDWHWGHLNFNDHSEVYRWLRCNRQIQKKTCLYNSIFPSFGNGHFQKFTFSCSMVFPILGRLWKYTNCLSWVNLLRWALPCACTLHPSQTGLVQFGGRECHSVRSTTE